MLELTLSQATKQWQVRTKNFGLPYALALEWMLYESANGLSHAMYEVHMKELHISNLRWMRGLPDDVHWVQ